MDSGVDLKLGAECLRGDESLGKHQQLYRQKAVFSPCKFIISMLYNYNPGSLLSHERISRNANIFRFLVKFLYGNLRLCLASASVGL